MTQAIFRAGLSTCIVADGEIPTVELSRQIVDATVLPKPLTLRISQGFFLSHAQARQIDTRVLHLLVRVADPSAHVFVQQLRRLDMPYAYLIDDNFWLVHQGMGVSLYEYYCHPLVRRSLQETIAGASVVLCHSEHFAVFLRHFNPRVEVVPAPFSFELLNSLPPPVAHNEIRVGVVANSSRAGDLDMVLPAIETVLAARPEVVFEFIGWTPPELRKHARVRSFEYTPDYSAFLSLKVSRGWLLGLAPLQPNRFGEYKSNNKYREFGGCGIAALYSDSCVYRDCVRDGDTGWLVANDPRAWVGALLRAIDDPANTRCVGQRARTDVLAHYHLHHVAARWQLALEPLVQRLATEQWRLRWARLRAGLREKVISIPAQIVNQDGSLLADLDKLSPREVLLELHPGQNMFTDIPAPLAGSFRWSGIIATFRAKLTGELCVRYEDDEGEIHSESLDLDTLPDGATVPFRCTVRQAGRIQVYLSSRASGPLAMYALGGLGSTTFSETGYQYPMVFAV